MVNTIQTNISSKTKVVTASSGRLYTAYRYTLAGISYLAMAYSDDAGFTWTEVAEVDSTGKSNLVIAIDSLDVIHLGYSRSTYKVSYRIFSNGAWGTEEDIFDGTSNTDDIFSLDLAISNSDIPHIGWSQYSPSTTSSNLFYSNRSSGSWAARTQLTNSDSYSGSNINPRNVKILISPNGHIWAFFTMPLGIGAAFGFCKYETFWTGPTILEFQFATNSAPAAVALSSNDAHVILAWSTPETVDWKYTSSTDSWARTQINAGNNGAGSVGKLVNDTLIAVWGGGYRTYNGTWSGSTTYDTGSDSSAEIATPWFPLVQALNTQVPTAGFQVTFIESTLGLRFFRSSDLNLQTPVTYNYSKEAAAGLASGDGSLSNNFSDTEYDDVAAVDAQTVVQSATNEYSIFEFKNKGNSSSDNIVATWIGQSNIAPSASTVYLQIYNRNSATWETVASNNTAGANTNFSLSTIKSTGLSNYYNGDNWVSFRVYQLAI